MDEANGYNFPSSDWQGTRGINGYGYVFSEDYPFIMPGYFGSELYPVVTLDPSDSGTRPQGPPKDRGEVLEDRGEDLEALGDQEIQDHHGPGLP